MNNEIIENLTEEDIITLYDDYFNSVPDNELIGVCTWYVICADNRTGKYSDYAGLYACSWRCSQGKWFNCDDDYNQSRVFLCGYVCGSGRTGAKGCSS